MNPFDKIKQQIDEDLHHKLPKKWKKIGDILIADFSLINTNDLSHVSQIYANILKVKTVLQKNKVNGELRKPERTDICLLYTSPSPRDRQKSRMPSSA